MLCSAFNAKCHVCTELWHTQSTGHRISKNNFLLSPVAHIYSLNFISVNTLVASLLKKPVGIWLLEEADCLAAFCDHFVLHFADKIFHICAGLDSTLTVTGSDGVRVLLYPVIWDTLQLIQSEDFDKILRSSLRPTTSLHGLALPGYLNLLGRDWLTGSER